MENEVPDFATNPLIVTQGSALLRINLKYDAIILKNPQSIQESIWKQLLTYYTVQSCLMQNYNFDQLVLYLNQFDEKCLCSVDINDFGILVNLNSSLRSLLKLWRRCVWFTKVFFFSGEKNWELYLSKKKNSSTPNLNEFLWVNYLFYKVTNVVF